MQLRSPVLAIVAALLSASLSLADTWTVDGSGGGDFLTIWAAVNAASDGDEIIVAPGTYTTSSYAVVLVSGKSLWIHSSDGYSVTTIDGEDKAMCVWLQNSSSTIEGFTIKRGFNDLVGGMYVYGDDATVTATITNCLFTDNHATIVNAANTAGALSTSGLANAVVSDCLVYDNTSPRTGGIYLGGNSSIANCVISGNSGGSYGGGITILSGDISISQSSIEYNEGGDASGGAGGLWIYAGGVQAWAGGAWHHQDSTNVTMTDCYFSENTSPDGVDKQILVSDGGWLQMHGDNVVDNTYAENSGSLVAFHAGSTCTMLGPYDPSYQVTTGFDIDDLDTGASLLVSGGLQKQGGLSVKNYSGSLVDSQVGQVIPLAQASAFSGAYDSVVFPTMPGGLGLELIEYSDLDGGSAEMGLQVIEVEAAQLAEPFVGDLESPPVDVASFDADGDGTDELAVLFGGTPGGVAIFAVSADGSPTPIDGFTAAVGNGPIDLDAGDLNGDGIEDLIVANADDDSVTVLVTSESNGDLSFLTSTLQVPGTNHSISCVAVIDWDGNTDLDAVVGVDIDSETAADNYRVAIDVATNAPEVGPAFDIPLYQPEVGSPVPDAPTCVDGGGQGSSWGFVGGTRFGRVHRVVSDGSLQVIASLTGSNTTSIMATELDDDGGDGQIDLIVSSDQAETIYLFQGNAAEGDGFGSTITVPVSEPVEDAHPIDADRDGDMDIVVAAPSSNTPLLLLRNDGVAGLLNQPIGGRTWSKQAMGTGGSVNQLASGDVDPGDVGDTKDLDDWVIGIAKQPGFRGGPVGTVEQTNLIGAGALDVFMDQIGDDDGSGVSDTLMVCQYFEDAQSQYDVAACDNFDTAGTAAISSVESVISGSNGWIDPSWITAYEINLYSNPEAAGASLTGDVGSQMVDAADAEISGTWTGEGYLIKCNVSLDTIDGTNWVSMIPDQDFATNGQSCIIGSTIGPGDGCIQANPAGGFGFGPWWHLDDDAAYRVTGQLGGRVPCDADLDGSGTVGVADLLIVIGQWGPCKGCDGDIDGDGIVGIADLLTVIGAWGPCS